jgi:hypothetical protein
MKKTTTTKKSKKVTSSTDVSFKASIKIFGKTYEAVGSTVKEALEKLKPIGTPKGMSVISVSKGDIRKDKILLPPQTFRLFSPSRIMREIGIKQTSMLFDGL